MSEEKNQARKFEIMLSNEEAERLSDMAGEHGLTVSQLIADLLHDLIRRQIYGSYSGEHASEWLWRCDYGNSLCSFLQFLAVQGLLTAALDDWDGIEDAKTTSPIIRSIQRKRSRMKWNLSKNGFGTVKLNLKMIFGTIMFPF